MNRQFAADPSNQLWAAGFNYVTTWQGFDVFRPSECRPANLAFAVDDPSCLTRLNNPCATGNLLAASSSITVTGVLLVSTQYTERLADAGVEPLVASVGELRLRPRRD